MESTHNGKIKIDSNVNKLPTVLSSYEEMMSNYSYPSYYYEWVLIEKLKCMGIQLRNQIFDESYKYPKVNQIILSIKPSLNYFDEQLYPSGLQSWINEMSKLALLITNNDEAASTQLILRVDEGSYDAYTIRYYRLCVEAFRKLAKICQSHPFGAPVAMQAAKLAASINAKADISTTDYLRKLLALPVVPISSEGLEILHLIRLPESKKLEFKSSLRHDVRKNDKNKNLIKECTKTIAAFLNTEGGILLVGVDDAGNVLGLKQDLLYCKNSDDEFLCVFKEAIKNHLGDGFFHNIDWQLEPLAEKKSVLIVKVRPSAAPCFDSLNNFYVRTNPASDTIKTDEGLKNYISDRFS
ncbi:MAG: hypothetical protein ACI8SJ_001683 [Shewanella sp.]|jgi:hypothetical protein